MAITILKIFYITHFEKLFNTDPKMLADFLLKLIVIFAFLPCLVFSWTDTVSEKPRTPKGVALLAGLTYQEGGLPLSVLYTSGLSLVCALIVTVCNLLLGFCPHRILPSRATFHAFEQNRDRQLDELISTANLKKLALGSVMSAFVGGLSFYFNYRVTGSFDNIQLPLPVLLSPFLINIVLAYYLIDPNVATFLKQLLRRHWQPQMGCQGHKRRPTLEVEFNSGDNYHRCKASGLLALAATRSMQAANTVLPLQESPLSYCHWKRKHFGSSDVVLATCEVPPFIKSDGRRQSFKEADNLTPVS